MATATKDKLVTTESLKRLHDYSEETYATKEELEKISKAVGGNVESASLTDDGYLKFE